MNFVRPPEVLEKLEFIFGEKPLFDYLRKRAQLDPDKTAINFYGYEMSYKELDENSDKFANFLLDKGVKKGDPVVLFLPNCPQFAISYFGIHKIGAVVTPCNPVFKEWDMEYDLIETGAELIVVHDQLYPIVANVKSKTKLKNIVVTSYSDYLPETQTIPLCEGMDQPKRTYEGTSEFVDIMERYEPLAPDVDIDIKNDTALLMFTSGTTGLPKGAELTYFNALYKTATCSTLYKYDVNDISLNMMPICHIAGMLYCLNIPIYSGGTSVLITRFEPETVMKAIDIYKCTKWYASPMPVRTILEHDDFDKYDYTSMKLTPATSFGMVITQELADRWAVATGGAPLFELAYGLTETHTGDTYMPIDKIKFGKICVGVPVHDCEIKILNPDTGEEALDGESGEILVKNPGIFKGYLNKPDATDEVLKDGWLSTGDIGMMCEEGYLHFLGRKKEMIKTSGFSVFPEEVESYIVRHEAVSEVAVYGVQDERHGEVVKAAIVLKDSYKNEIKEAEIIDWCKERMAGYKAPRFIEFINEIPKGGTGKILRRVLVDKDSKDSK